MKRLLSLAAIAIVLCVSTFHSAKATWLFDPNNIGFPNPNSYYAFRYAGQLNASVLDNNIYFFSDTNPPANAEPYKISMIAQEPTENVNYPDVQGFSSNFWLQANCRVYDLEAPTLYFSKYNPDFNFLSCASTYNPPDIPNDPFDPIITDPVEPEGIAYAPFYTQDTGLSCRTYPEGTNTELTAGPTGAGPDTELGIYDINIASIDFLDIVQAIPQETLYDYLNNQSNTHSEAFFGSTGKEVVIDCSSINVRRPPTAQEVIDCRHCTLLPGEPVPGDCFSYTHTADAVNICNNASSSISNSPGLYMQLHEGVPPEFPFVTSGDNATGTPIIVNYDVGHSVPSIYLGANIHRTYAVSGTGDFNVVGPNAYGADIDNLDLSTVLPNLSFASQDTDSATYQVAVDYTIGTVDLTSVLNNLQNADVGTDFGIALQNSAPSIALIKMFNFGDWDNMDQTAYIDAGLTTLDEINGQAIAIINNEAIDNNEQNIPVRINNQALGSAGAPPEVFKDKSWPPKAKADFVCPPSCSFGGTEPPTISNVTVTDIATGAAVPYIDTGSFSITGGSGGGGGPPEVFVPKAYAQSTSNFDLHWNYVGGETVPSSGGFNLTATLTNAGGGGGGGGGASYHFLKQDGDEWKEFIEEHFGTHYSIKRTSVEGLTADAEGNLTFRVNQFGTDEAHIDYIALAVDDRVVSPSRFIDIETDKDWTKKVSSQDDDVVESTGKTFEATFENVSGTVKAIYMRANEENLNPDIQPFYYPNTQGFLPLTLDNKATMKVDGVIDAAEAKKLPNPRVVRHEVPTSGHPSGDMHAYFTHDNSNLYATLDVGYDNTQDDEDITTVTIRNGDKEKTFTIDAANQKYGKRGFGYTDIVGYEHAMVEAKIPLSEIGAKPGDTIDVRFSYYGTAGGGGGAIGVMNALLNINVYYNAPFISEMRVADEEGANPQVGSNTVFNGSAELQADVGNAAASCGLPYNCSAYWELDQANSTTLDPDSVSFVDVVGVQGNPYNNSTISDPTISVTGLGAGGSPGNYVFVLKIFQDVNNNTVFDANELVSMGSVNVIVATAEWDTGSFTIEKVAGDNAGVHVNNDLLARLPLTLDTVSQDLCTSAPCSVVCTTAAGTFTGTMPLSNQARTIDASTTGLAITPADEEARVYLMRYTEGDSLDPRSAVGPGDHTVTCQLLQQFEGIAAPQVVDIDDFMFHVDNTSPNVTEVRATQGALTNKAVSGAPITVGFHTGGFLYGGSTGAKFSDNDPTHHLPVAGQYYPNESYAIVGFPSIVITPASPNGGALAQFTVPNTPSTVTVRGTIYDQWFILDGSAENSTTIVDQVVDMLPRITSVVPSQNPVLPGGAVTITGNVVNESGSAVYQLTQAGGDANQVVISVGGAPNIFTFTAPPVDTTLNFTFRVDDEGEFDTEDIAITVSSSTLNLNSTIDNTAHCGESINASVSVTGGGGATTYSYDWVDAEGSHHSGAQNTASTSDAFVFTAPVDPVRCAAPSTDQTYSVIVTSNDSGSSQANEVVTITNAAPVITATLNYNGNSPSLGNGVSTTCKQAPDAGADPITGLEVAFSISEPDGDQLPPGDITRSGTAPNNGFSVVGGGANPATATATVNFDRTTSAYTLSVSAKDEFGVETQFSAPITIANYLTSTAVSGFPTGSNPWNLGGNYSGLLSLINATAGENVAQQTTVCGGNINKALVSGATTLSPSVLITSPTADASCGTSKVAFTISSTCGQTYIREHALSSSIGGGGTATPVGERIIRVVPDIVHESGDPRTTRTLSCERRIDSFGLGDNVVTLFGQQMSMKVYDLSKPNEVYDSLSTSEVVDSKIQKKINFAPGNYRLTCEWIDKDGQLSYQISDSLNLSLSMVEPSHGRGLSTSPALGFEAAMIDPKVDMNLKLNNQERLYELVLQIAHNIPDEENPKKVIIDLTTAEANLFDKVETNLNGVTATLADNKLTVQATQGLLPENISLRMWVIPPEGLIPVRPSIKADSGPNTSGFANKFVRLDGSKSYSVRPGGIRTVNWEVLSTPQGVSKADIYIENSTALIASAKFPQPGLYVLQITVNDGTENSTDTVSVNVLPDDQVVANLRTPQAEVLVGQPVFIDGSYSLGEILDWKWTTSPEVERIQEEGMNPNSPAMAGANKRFGFVPQVPGEYTITLEIIGRQKEDGTVNKDIASIKIKAVNPVANMKANAGEDQNMKTGDTVTLDGSKSYCLEGETSYRWRSTGGKITTLENVSSVKANFIIGKKKEDATTYILSLNISCDGGKTWSDPDTVDVSAEFIATAIAKTKVSSPEALPARIGDTIVLDGSGSAGSGAIKKYVWKQIEGPQVSFENMDTAQIQFLASATGHYVFELIVDDANGSSQPSSIEFDIIAANQEELPAQGGLMEERIGANAGPDQVVAVGTQGVILDGSASRLPDGEVITQWIWTQSEGPIVGGLLRNQKITFNAPNTPTTLKFRLVLRSAQNVYNELVDEVEIQVVPEAQGNVQGFHLIPMAYAASEESGNPFEINVAIAEVQDDKGIVIKKNGDAAHWMKVKGSFGREELSQNFFIGSVITIAIILIAALLLSRRRRATVAPMRNTKGNASRMKRM